jgi:hypothetical protein
MDNVQHKVHIMNSSSGSTLLMEPEISETLVCNSTLTQLIARGHFDKFIPRENFKYYITDPPLSHAYPIFVPLMSL